jgi:isocitrate lyase
MTEATKEKLTQDWAQNSRWKGVKRGYSAEDVARLRGSVQIEHTLAKLGAEKLWKLLHERPYVNSLGALTGNQAVQQVRAGVPAIYLSGWQVAADANDSLHMYPDQSLYAVSSVPTVVKRINNALLRADQIQTMEGKSGKENEIDWLAPIVADAESGFGGVLNAFELMKSMIEAGAAGVHYEDQLASVKKCGHMGGKVLVPTQEAVQKLIAARLAADIMGVPTVLLARTDAEAADMVWCETGTPDLAFAKKFAEGIRNKHPEKMLAYNCSPSFNWKRNLDDATIAKFQRELGAMGYKFQFITLAGFHQLNYGMFELARDYRERHMAAYSELQQAEFAAEAAGYTATRHQREVGTGYFDAVSMTITGGFASTTAMTDSTEAAQFNKDEPRREAA